VRNFQQTTSGLDDYNADGTKAVKLAVNYNFGNYGTNVRSSLTEKEYDGSMHSFDWNIGYKFMDGALEGLNIRTFRSKFRGNDIVHKADRNDTKVLISYSVKLK